MTRSLPFQTLRVFMDASGYFALAHARDASHAETVVIREQLTAELHALLRTRVNCQIALAVLTEIDSSRMTTLVRVHHLDEQRARDILRQYDDKDFSLTDAVSFAVMERLGINLAFSLDHHFGQYGWQLVGSDPPARGT